MNITKTFTKDNDKYIINLTFSVKHNSQIPHIQLEILKNGNYINYHPDADNADTFAEYHKLYMEKLTEIIPLEWIKEMKYELLAVIKLQLNKIL